jgi:uncharacterized protein
MLVYCSLDCILSLAERLAESDESSMVLSMENTTIRVLLQIPGSGGERSDELSAPRGSYAATPKMEWMNCR